MTAQPLEICVIRSDVRDAKVEATETVVGDAALQIIPPPVKSPRKPRLCVIGTPTASDMRWPRVGSGV
jgi:hypothetical protein